MFCKHLSLLLMPHPAHTDPPVLFPLVPQITRGPTSDQLFDNKNWKIANQILKGLCVTNPNSWARKIRDGTTCQMSKKKIQRKIQYARNTFMLWFWGNMRLKWQICRKPNLKKESNQVVEKTTFLTMIMKYWKFWEPNFILSLRV